MSDFKKDLAEVLAFKAGFNAFVSQSAARANESDKRLKSIESTISDIASKVNAVKPKPEAPVVIEPKNYDDEIKSLSQQIESARRTFGEEVGLLTKELRGFKDGE